MIFDVIKYKKIKRGKIMGIIVGVGGGRTDDNEIQPVFEHIVKLSNKKKPRVLFVPTAGFDDINGDGLNFVAGKTVHYVNSKAFAGTVLAHTDGDVPNIVIEIDKQDEYTLGWMIYFFEKACGISGYILGVNPFDQPGVESYKKNMFALLGKPGYEAEKEALEARLK